MKSQNLTALLFLCLCWNASAQVIDLKKAKDKVKTKAQELTTEENLKKEASSISKSLEKSRAQFDSTDFDYAILLSDNAALFDVKEKGEFWAKAETGFTLTVNKVNNDVSDEDRAQLNLELGEMAYASRKFTFAEQRLLEALQNFEKASLTKDVNYAKTIADLGLLYATTGRYSQAEERTNSALELRKEILGDKNIGVAASLNNAGVLDQNLARYNEAEEVLTQALAILEAADYKNTMQFAIVSNNQAMVFQSIGRYEQAESVLKNAIALAEKFQSAKSTNHLKFLSNLALLYQQMGKYTDAESIYLGMEKRLGKNNPDYANMLLNLASLYMVMGKDDKVEDPLKKSVAIYKSNFGEKNPAYARAVADLGNFYRYKDRFAEAESMLSKSLEIRAEMMGKNHPAYVQNEEDLAILFWKKKEWNSSYTMYRSAMDKSLDFVNRYFPPMSEAEKTKYWDVLFPRFQRFYNFAVEASLENQAVIQDICDYQIATKGLLLNSTNRIKTSILQSKDNALIKDYLVWLDQKERLARLYAYSKSELNEQHINLDSLERATNSLERSLSEKSAEFSSGYSTEKTNYNKVHALLAEGDALVQVIRVRKFDKKFTDDSKYLMLVHTRGADRPKLLVLENGQQLETRYAKYYRNAIQQKLNDEYSYNQYWEQLDKELTGKKTIYLSPDGVYNQINLNTLKTASGDFFINRYDLVTIGNTKDLVAIKSRKTKAPSKKATLIGFPDYGTTDVSPLPGTKVELDAISKSLKAAGYQVTAFSQKTATEKNIKSVKNPTVLHIATHGYFLQDVESAKGSAFGVQMENATNNPLLRSGLLLAGAGKTVAGAEPNLQSNDNGVLTAYEAMNLDLANTDLVVLSACETGLGEVKAGEGVYGLQRAFLVAGADAIIMSLWRVDDAATQQLMSSFYANWLKSGNKQKAFKQAQLQLMTKFKEPYYWGAFVMIGM